MGGWNHLCVLGNYSGKRVAKSNINNETVDGFGDNFTHVTMAGNDGHHYWSVNRWNMLHCNYCIVCIQEKLAICEQMHAN